MSASHSKPWRYLAARLKKLYVPPGRPSPDDLAGYRRLLRKAIRGKKNPRALILGATPDLRDLLFDEGVHCTMMDLTMKMIVEMTQIRKRHDPEEIIVKANWLRHPLAPHQFDAILGDFVVAQLPWKLQHQFFVSVRDMLKPNGSFITRVEYLAPGWEEFNIATTLERFGKLPTHPWRFLELFAEILHHRYDPRTHTSGGPQMIKELSRFGSPGKWRHPNKKVTRLLAQIWELWKPMEKVWTLETEAQHRRRFARYFKIIAEHWSRDYPTWRYSPIWMCKPKR